MKSALFIDTGAFYARYVARDEHHARAIPLWKHIAEQRTPCLTTNFVVAELITLLTYRFGTTAGLQAAREMYGSHRLHILSITTDIELQGLEWLERFSDQAFSITDATSFAVMETRKLTTAFTFDHHFTIAGFQPL